jgi:hypothetical protein
MQEEPVLPEKTLLGRLLCRNSLVRKGQNGLEIWRASKARLWAMRRSRATAAK